MMHTPLSGQTVRGGRLESRAPVRQVSPGGGTALMTADPNRVTAMFSASFPAGGTTADSVLIGFLVAGQFTSFVVLTSGSPMYVLRYEDIGDLIYQAWFAIDNTVGGAIVTAVSTFWHPED